MTVKTAPCTFTDTLARRHKAHIECTLEGDEGGRGGATGCSLNGKEGGVLLKRAASNVECASYLQSLWCSALVAADF